jgi:hypothetical protein
MNETGLADWQLILIFSTIAAIFFGAVWFLVQDTKKSAHARMDRIETDFRTMETTCNTRLATYVNKDDVTKIDHRLDGMDKDIKSGFNTLTGRIDDLLLAFTNGKRKGK